ncbi:unnamed protein product, partial [marine sediment metagenome]
DIAINEDEIPLSACCGALQYNEVEEMCGKCKEWTHFIVTCQVCKGRGSIYRDEHNDEPCPACDDGFIEI